MFDYTQFSSVYPPSARFPYDRRTLQEIEACRNSSDGILFIDRVLQAVGITKAAIYPPKTEAALRALHQQLCDADMTTHHRLSLIYYVLLDYDEAGDAAVSQVFADAAGVPARYQTMMRGLWHMDRQQFSPALEHLCHPSLTSDFADDIIVSLARHDPGLVLRYYHTVRPALSTSAALDALLECVCRADVAEAFFLTRTFPEHVREPLLRRLIVIVLGGGGGGGRSSGDKELDDEVRARELALLPYDPLEETWFEDFLETGEGRTLPGGRDALVMRRIAAGRYTAAATTEGAGPHWGGVLQGLRGGL